jgi:hypothetical protein
VNDWVSDALKNVRAVRFVFEEARQAEETRVSCFDERGEREVQDAFHSRAPALALYGLEGADDFGGGRGDAVTRDLRDDIECHDPVRVVRVEVDQVAGAAAGNFVEELVLQITVRVDDADAAAGVGMSWTIMLRKTLVLPMPVLPITSMWFIRSSAVSASSSSPAWVKTVPRIARSLLK